MVPCILEYHLLSYCFRTSPSNGPRASTCAASRPQQLATKTGLRDISSQECKEPKSYLGVDPSYTGDEEHNAMLCRCLKQKNKLRSRQQLLSSGPPCAEKLCSRKQETQTFGLLGARRESFDLSCKGLSNKPSGQHRRWHGIP